MINTLLLIQNKKYLLYYNGLFYTSLIFFCTGDRAGIDRLCGKKYDGSLQITCRSDIFRQFSIYGIMENFKKRIESNGEKTDKAQ